MTGKQEYYEVAYNHAKQTQKNIVREKSHHVPYVLFLIRKQAKLYTVRRNKDTQMILVGLCGQAWGIYGFYVKLFIYRR